jgi:chemotaxis protein CheD
MSSVQIRAGERRINLIQGEQRVERGADVVLTTILGSCVAACLFDTTAGIGGMNHFLLPGGQPGAPAPGRGDLGVDVTNPGSGAMRYGAYSMELLINWLLREGAARGRLQAKLFGGARMLKGLTDVGDSNAAFAEGFLREERIPIVGGSLRGDRGRRIQFWPATGRAQQIEFGTNHDAIFKTESRITPPPAPAASGSLELF